MRIPDDLTLPRHRGHPPPTPAIPHAPATEQLKFYRNIRNIEALEKFKTKSCDLRIIQRQAGLFTKFYCSERVIITSIFTHECFDYHTCQV